MRKRKEISTYINGVNNGDRIILSQAITIIESKNPEDGNLGRQILEGINKTSKTIRIGITGVPGVGKSTFIDVFGSYLTKQGHKVAVLSIDPSSQRSKGSILGDKTRMSVLSNDPNAFIRPSPSGTTLGGVANKTRETILLCEAAGFDVVIVETVGVGQSETTVKNMVDFFLLLALAGGGDELQGIKRGIMEMADAIAINKADGDVIKAAKKAKADFKNALHLFPLNENNWIPEVLLCSAHEKTGIIEIWEVILKFQEQMIHNGFLHKNRISQNIDWFHELLNVRLLEQLLSSPNMNLAIKRELDLIKHESKDPSLSVAEILALI